MPDNTSSFSGAEQFEYHADDLVAMSEAKNYYRWILNLFTPYRGNTILEIGAGIGTLCSIVMEEWGDHVQKYIALEPDNGLYGQLTSRIKEMNRSQVRCLNGFLKDNIKTIISEGIDTIIYVNVLEHVENDLEELTQARRLLKKRGHILTYSPARPELYSKLDNELGHYRRYTLNEMKKKMKRAGFEIKKAHYVDLPGYFLWWVKHRLLKQTVIKPSQVRLFDRIIVPLLSHLEPSRLLPFGKNILAVGATPNRK